MRGKLLVLIGAIVAVAVLWAGAAVAQTAGPALGGTGIDEIVKATTWMTFETTRIKGAIVEPGAVFGVAKPQATFDLTIKVRTSFLPEVMGTVDSL